MTIQIRTPDGHLFEVTGFKPITPEQIQAAAEWFDCKQAHDANVCYLTQRDDHIVVHYSNGFKEKLYWGVTSHCWETIEESAKQRAEEAQI